MHWGVKESSTLSNCATKFNTNRDSSQINAKQEIIPVECVLPAWKPYVVPVSVATTICHGGGGLFRSPNEQVWTGLRWSPPDVTSRGAKSWGLMTRGGGQGVSPQVWCPGWRGYPTMWPISWCIWCYLNPSLVNRHTPMHNITFPQLRLWAVTMQWHLKMDVWDSIKSQDKRDTMVTVTVNEVAILYQFA